MIIVMMVSYCVPAGMGERCCPQPVCAKD